MSRENLSKDEMTKILNKVLDLLKDSNNWNRFEVKNNYNLQVTFGVSYHDKDYIEIEERRDYIHVKLDVSRLVYSKKFLDCFFGPTKVLHKIADFIDDLETKAQEIAKLKTLNEFLGEK